MKLLLVEDNKQLRSMLSRFLENEGYDVLEAETGEIGLAFFDQEIIDLVLLDIMLPGIDVLKYVKQLDSHQWFRLL